MSFPMTFEEYPEFEEQSRIRHEYIAGGIFAMTGSDEASFSVNRVPAADRCTLHLLGRR